MNVYLLEAKEWQGWSSAQKYVVVAESETQARELAYLETFKAEKARNTEHIQAIKDAWIGNGSTCEIVSSEKAGVILEANNGG